MEVTGKGHHISLYSACVGGKLSPLEGSGGGDEGDKTYGVKDHC